MSGVGRTVTAVRSLALVAGVAGILAVSGACDVCFGTPACNNPPQISYGGQFIERKSGAPVAGVLVEFVRRSGSLTMSDTVRAVSDGDGFFQLRLDALQDGEARGDLRVTPPLPHSPYVVAHVALSTSRRRADGHFFGRLVVNPYFMLIGEVYDRFSGALVPGATVTLRRKEGAFLEADSMTFTTDENGRLAWIEPAVLQFGILTAEFEVVAPGYPRPYRVERDVVVHHIDGNISFVRLPLGMGLSYKGATARRGNGEHFPGVRIEFRRTSGIAVTPEHYVTTANDNGDFAINLTPLAQGAVTGDLTITPPAPYPQEVLRDIELEASDDDIPGELGVLGFGTHAFVSGHFRYRGTGLPVSGGVLGQVRRVGGLATLGRPGDQGLRAFEEDGRLLFAEATTDTGVVLYDITTMLRPPFVPETLKAVPIPSRYSDDPTDLGVIRVGSWYPWRALLRDFDTDQPIAGASVSFRRLSGASIVSNAFGAISAADGSVPLHPVPTERGTLVAELVIRATGYRDTTIAGVSLGTTEDDTLRTLATYRLRRP